MDHRLQAVAFGGDRYSGNTRPEILRAMKNSSIFVADKTLAEYVDWMLDSIYRYHGVSATLADGTVEERAEGMVRILEKHDLLRIRETPEVVK